MGHVIGIGKMERPNLPELPRSIPTIRRGSIGECEFANSYSAKSSHLDEGKLEVSSNRDICVTVIDIHLLNKAARRVVESERGSRIRRWSAIAVVTWAIASTIIATMQYRTIQELELLSRQAAAIIYNSDRNQREVIETVRQSIRNRDEQDSRARFNTSPIRD